MFCVTNIWVTVWLGIMANKIDKIASKMCINNFDVAACDDPSGSYIFSTSCFCKQDDGGRSPCYLYFTKDSNPKAFEGLHPPYPLLYFICNLLAFKIYQISSRTDFNTSSYV